MSKAEREARGQQVRKRLPHDVGQLAEVELHTGRWCLMVAGMVLAMETDPCREWTIEGNRWTKEMLEEAAAHINAAHRLYD